MLCLTFISQPSHNISWAAFHPSLKHTEGRHALEAFHWSPGSETHIALVTPSPPKCFLTPSPTAQTGSHKQRHKESRGECCKHATFPLLGRPSSYKHILHVPPESLAPVPVDHRLQFLMLLPMSRPEFQTCSPHGTCPSQTHRSIHPLSSPQLDHASAGLQKWNSGMMPSDSKVHNCTLQMGTYTLHSGAPP